MKTIGVIIVLASIIIGVATAYYASRGLTSGETVMAILLLASAGIVVGLFVFGIGVLSG